MKVISVIGKRGYIAQNYRTLSKNNDCTMNFIQTSEAVKNEAYPNTINKNQVNDILWLGYGTEFYKYNGEKNEVKLFKKFLEKKHGSNCRIIFISSGGTVYEKSELPYKENNNLKSFNKYGDHKITMEKILINSGINYIILRLGNVYGGKTARNLTHGVVNIWVNNLILGKPIKVTASLKSFQDYIYIKDLVDALDKIIESKISKSIFNLSFGSPVTLESIYNILQNNFKFINSIIKKENSVNNFVLETTQINQYIGWRPKYNIESGILDFVRDIRKSRLD